jgi:hypothetical protein
MRWKVILWLLSEYAVHMKQPGIYELLWKEREKMCDVVQIASRGNGRKQWGSEKGRCP